MSENPQIHSFHSSTFPLNGATCSQAQSILNADPSLTHLPFKVSLIFPPSFSSQIRLSLLFSISADPSGSPLTPTREPGSFPLCPRAQVQDDFFFQKPVATPLFPKTVIIVHLHRSQSEEP